MREGGGGGGVNTLFLGHRGAPARPRPCRACGPAQQCQVVHIDYGVCFDRGASLRVPELVPCRLSPCLVAALGPTAVEGRFRVAAEVAAPLPPELRFGTPVCNAPLCHSPPGERPFQRLLLFRRLESA